MKLYQMHFPEIVTKGSMISTEVDFGDLINDQEIVRSLSTSIATFSYLSRPGACYWCTEV